MIARGKQGWANADFLASFAGAPPAPAAGASAPSFTSAPIDVAIADRNLLYVHPKVRAAVTAVQSQLAAESIPLRACEAYRAPERQDHL